jgi:hypothetical protein
MRILTIVPKHQFLFLESSELKENPHEVVRQCLVFLGVDPALGSYRSGELHHRAVVPRFPGITRWLNKDSKLKTALKIMLPIKSVRSVARGKLIAANEKPANNLKVDPLLRRSLIGRYRKDIACLEDITGLDLSKWYMNES